MADKEIYVLYGSQTGNAEAIAKDFQEQLVSAGVPSQCDALNSFKKVAMGDKAKGLVIVCSTTGNGDAPENCDGWWRSTKLRSAAKDLFQDVPYTVLGLGDTNYDKFCHMGKIIDKRLAELGGKKFMDGTWVDEATGLEEPIEAWKIKVFDLVMSINDDTFQWPNSEAAVEGATEAVKSLTIESAAETTAQKEAESAPAPAPLPTA